jgi:ABC-2 type transport system permease protein
MPQALSNILAVARRVLRQLANDRRFLALSLIAPLAIIFLLKVFIDSLDLSPPAGSQALENLMPLLESPDLPADARELLAQALPPLLTAPRPKQFDPTQFAVPLGAFFIHFFTYLLCAIVLVRERIAQTLGRMFVSGYRQVEIIGGYVLAYTGLATLQSLLVLTELSLLFKLEFSPAKFLSIYLVIWLLAVISIALGMFVSNFARSEGQVFPFIPLVVLPSIFLSGVIISADKLPGWTHPLSYLVPLYYANDVLQRLVQPGGTLRDAWTSLLALPLYGGAILFLATRTLQERD